MIRVSLASLAALTVCNLVVAQKVPPTKLNTLPSGQSSATAPVIAASDSSVYVAWLEAGSGSPNVLFNRSLAGGNRERFPSGSTSKKIRLSGLGSPPISM